MTETNTIAFITAGGKSTRMGTDKGLLEYKGKPMVSYSIKAAKAVFDKVELLANLPGYENFGLEVHTDLVPEKGPLGGLYTAFKTVPNSDIFYLACDTPNISAELIQFLMDEVDDPHDAIVPTLNGKEHPLCALYKATCLERIKELVKGDDTSMMGLLRHLEVKYVALDDQFDPAELQNINSQEELPLNTEEHAG